MQIIFLGYDKKATSLISFMERDGHHVVQTAEKIASLEEYDLAISFGYRHIISQPVLDTAKNPPLNLHIAYLPFNRGSHPNFWSWMEGTPSGVTIHEIDAGLDTGPILYQRKLSISEANITFKQTHSMLLEMVETLFQENFLSIVNKSYITQSQSQKGTSHRSTELPTWLTSWDMKITDARNIYNKKLMSGKNST